MPNYVFVQGDKIRDEALVERLFTEYDIRGVIHFAAESHVDNSIKGPRTFMETKSHGHVHSHRETGAPSLDGSPRQGEARL